MIMIVLLLICIFNIGVLVVAWRQYDYAKANLEFLGRDNYEMVKILRNDADKLAKAFQIAHTRSKGV